MQRHLGDAVNEFGTGAASAAIIELIEDGLRAKNEAGQAERLERKGTLDKQNPYVTDIAKCPRQVWLSLANVPETNPLTTDTLITFGIGHAVEAWLTSMLRDAGGVLLDEFSMSMLHEVDGKTCKISGRFDILAVFPEHRMLIELKSVNSRAMSWMLKRGEEGKDDHRRQVNAYMHASALGLFPCLTCEGIGIFDLGEDGKPKCADCKGSGVDPSLVFDKAVLVYAVKDTMKGEPPIHAWEVAYDKSLALRDLTILHRINDMVQLGEEIAIPDGYNPKKFPCSYCRYKDHCFS